METDIQTVLDYSHDTRGETETPVKRPAGATMAGGVRGPSVRKQP